MVSRHELSQNRFYDWLKPEEFPETNTIDRLTLAYVCNLNLGEELAGFSSGAVVWDVGCGYGSGTEGLQQKFSEQRFLGVDPFRIQSLTGERINVPIVEGSVADLSDVVKIIDPVFYPPTVILLRNVMQLLDLAQQHYEMPGLLEDAFLGIDGVLAKGGKVLIYDEDAGDETYERYVQLIKDLGLGYKGEVKPVIRANRGGCLLYLQLIKGL